MTHRDFHDDEIDELLSGAGLRGETTLSSFMHRLRSTYRVQPDIEVGPALSEFVDLHATAPIPMIDLSTTQTAPATRSSKKMWKKLSAGVLVGAAGIAFLGSIASAGDSLDNGDYSLVLPGIGAFEFTIDSVGVDETIVAIAAPEGYAVDDDSPDKVAWRDSASLEVEVKSDKIEGDYDWAGGDAVLTLPDGGSITVSEPDGDGDYTVTASGGWTAFGSGDDWIVANADDIADATEFFKVEADADGIEIKPVESPGDDFLNNLDADDDDESHDSNDDDESDDDESDDDDHDDDDDDDDDDESENRGNDKDKDDDKDKDKDKDDD